MLVKCVCSNCGHSYLSDDEAAHLACPRCDSDDEGMRNPSDIPDAPMGGMPDFMEEPVPAEEFQAESALRFEAKAPPPMFITRERLLRSLVFGSVVTGAIAAVIGAAMAATSVDVPAVAAVLIALTGGAAVRSGFGGRSAAQTKGRAAVICAIVVLFGFAAFSAGTWAIDRLTGSRAEQTQEDIAEGLKNLTYQYADSQDAGLAVVLKQRIEEAQRLRSLSDSQIEDYLWIQQAQINNALLAHAKLRFTEAPVVKLGPDSDPVTVRMEATLGIRLAEIILAMVLAARAVRPKA